MLSRQFKFFNRLSQVFNLNQSAGLDEMSRYDLAVAVPEDDNENQVHNEYEEKRIKDCELKIGD